MFNHPPPPTSVMSKTASKQPPNYLKTTSKLPQNYPKTFGIGSATPHPSIYCPKESPNMREQKYPKTFGFGLDPTPPLFGKCPKVSVFFLKISSLSELGKFVRVVTFSGCWLLVLFVGMDGWYGWALSHSWTLDIRVLSGINTAS